jgi:hypothetical protein
VGGGATRLGGADGTPRVEVGLGATVHITVHWDWWTVGRCHLLIDLFKFKFNCLNTNSII